MDVDKPGERDSGEFLSILFSVRTGFETGSF